MAELSGAAGVSYLEYGRGGPASWTNEAAGGKGAGWAQQQAEKQKKEKHLAMLKKFNK